MNYVLNCTADYHRKRLDTLGWELTMCNSLEAPESPCRMLLDRPDSYGNLLHDFLAQEIPFDRIKKVLEVGGGYGCLMRDFLMRDSGLEAVMLDISPYLLERQRNSLAFAAEENRVRFVEENFLETDPGFPASFDLAILNENLGDFPTLTSITREFFYSPYSRFDDNLLAARQSFLKYNLEIPERYPFNINMGAIQALEKLCSSGIQYIFLSEHSCEATLGSGGIPKKIRLKGHDEYTIKFSFLEKVAGYHGYEAKRGFMADYLHVNTNFDLDFCGAAREDAEAARHFLEDTYLYEYLLLSKKA
ncbi:MAG: methyltransferase [Syntrophaceae bacterium]